MRLPVCITCTSEFQDIVSFFCPISMKTNHNYTVSDSININFNSWEEFNALNFGHNILIESILMVT